MVQGAQLQGARCAGMHTGRFKAMFDAGDAQVAFNHFSVVGELGHAKGASRFAAVATHAKIPIDIHHRAVLVKKEGPRGAGRYTGRFVAMSARQRHEGDRSRVAIFHWDYLAQGQAIGFTIILVPAGDDAGHAAGTSLDVKKKG
jgi:hypothetical protein